MHKRRHVIALTKPFLAFWFKNLFFFTSIVRRKGSMIKLPLTWKSSISSRRLVLCTTRWQCSHILMAIPAPAPELEGSGLQGQVSEHPNVHVSFLHQTSISVLNNLLCTSPSETSTCVCFYFQGKHLNKCSTQEY